MDRSEPYTVETVLTPVDGSEESVTAVEFGVAIADRYSAQLHIVYLLGRGVMKGMEAGSVDREAVATNTEQFLNETASIAEEYDVPVSTSITHAFSPTRKSRHPGSVVLDTAESLGADFIVIPRESIIEEPAEILEQTAEYVLAYASQPVLSV